MRAAFAAGACGYLTKASTPEEIELAVREVLEGRFFVSPAVTWILLAATVRGASKSSGRAPREATTPAAAPFTRRETDIVRLVGQGLSNKAIAQRLGVAVTTVRSHLNRVHKKRGTASRVELALLAAQSTGAAI